MQYQGGLDIDFKFEGESMDLMPSTYSIAITDSIYEPYPKAEFILNDDSGVLQEYLFTVEGASYHFSFGIDGTYISSPLIVKNDELGQTLSKGIINGKVKVNLVHEYRTKQDIKSTFHSGKISSIVSDLVSSYAFEDTNIDVTGNDQDWYQLLVGDVEFIDTFLKPYAYSASANKSPFFQFIDNKNQYNFKSFYSMLKGASPIELTLTGGTDGGTSKTTILDIKRLRKGMDTTYDLRHRRVFNFSDTSGELIEDEDYIYDYPSSIQDLPIIGNSTYTTGVFLNQSSNTVTANKENLKGFLASSMKRSVTLDRFVITLPFNSDIVSGIPISLVIPTSENDTSLNLSGIYLCEQVTHSWTGERMITYAVVGRKDTLIPSGIYTLKDRLLS